MVDKVTLADFAIADRVVYALPTKRVLATVVNVTKKRMVIRLDGHKMAAQLEPQSQAILVGGAPWRKSYEIPVSQY